MNLKESKYSGFALVREMMGTVPTVEKFDPSSAEFVADSLRRTGRIMFAGEGSSRIMPAKNARRRALGWGLAANVQLEGCRQAAMYDLDDYTVLVDSNSGRTKEALALASKLKASGHREFFSLSANPDREDLRRRACARMRLGGSCSRHQERGGAGPFLRVDFVEPCRQGHEGRALRAACQT